MKRRSRHDSRILAVHPSIYGLGFAVLEGPEKLVDWGNRRAGRPKNARTFRQFSLLLLQFQPNVLVIEDVSARGCRRRQRIRRLIPKIKKMAKDRKVRVRSIARSEVQRFYSQVGATTKHWIAGAIASRFPELVIKLPPPRKPWMAEDLRMGIFDAVAYGQTYYYLNERRRSRRKTILS